jgi:hypothetical protein
MMQPQGRSLKTIVLIAAKAMDESESPRAVSAGKRRSQYSIASAAAKVREQGIHGRKHKMPSGAESWKNKTK